MTLRLTRLDARYRIVNPDGTPTEFFLRLLNKNSESVETNDSAQQEAIEAIQAAQDAADAANAAADNANQAAEASAAESSIVSSFVLSGSFAGASPLEADTSGNVTVKNHTRRYGNTSLNPDVAITGAVVGSGASAGSIVRVYYDDPTRSDTTPSFAFTLDPAAEPVQGGDRHVIGAVEIPGTGTSDGGWVRPPGYTGPEP